MSFNASRLTLYAIISALESDLRAAIESNLKAQKKIDEIFGVSLFQKVFLRIQKDQVGPLSALSLREMVHYLDFDDTFQVLNANRECLDPDIARKLKDATPYLQKITPIRNRVMHARPLEFDDLPVCMDIVEMLVSQSVFDLKNVEEARVRLRDNPAFVFGLSIPVINDDKISHNLPTPDFDETGFIGRRSVETQLRALLLGPYPVITVVGEGGQGKTALVLKVAYSFLDTSTPPFDAIVWSTAKSTQITAQEIVKIRGAISDSLGMLEAIQSEIVGKSENDPIDDIVEYLQEFKILLILDNLETVKDTRIDDLLTRLPAGSKVLITSRIGLGEYERRLRLDPLEEFDSIRLLQSLGGIRGLDILQKTNRDVLAAYCKKMKNNPGFIKWFVSAIQAGRRPEQILDQRGLFLEYCMSNVYGYLDADSRELLAILQTVHQQLSQAELAFLSGFEVFRLQKALYQLTATNMVRMGSFGVGSSAETKYSLSELARDYLSKYNPVLPHVASKYRRQFQEIREASNLIDRESLVNPFSFFSIVRRSRGELLVSKYLLDAVQGVHNKDLVGAFNNIEKARGLAPNFFEVHRVAAVANAVAGNIPEAEECYLTAIELEAKSAPLHYWYGNFLARSLHDAERAIEQYVIAETFAPGEPQIIIEYARSEMYLSRFDDALKRLQPLGEERKLHPHIARKVHDLILQIFLRESDFHFRHKDYVKSVSLMAKFINYLRQVPFSMRDRYMAATIKRSYYALDRCGGAVADVSSSREIESWKLEIVEQLRPLGISLMEAMMDRWNYGSIRRVIDGRYGFIMGDDNEDYYFNVGSLRIVGDVGDALIGRRVRFELGVNAEGVCAVNIGDEDQSGDGRSLKGLKPVYI